RSQNSVVCLDTAPTNRQSESQTRLVFSPLCKGPKHVLRVARRPSTARRGSTRETVKTHSRERASSRADNCTSAMKSERLISCARAGSWPPERASWSERSTRLPKPAKQRFRTAPVGPVRPTSPVLMAVMACAAVLMRLRTSCANTCLFHTSLECRVGGAGHSGGHLVALCSSRRATKGSGLLGEDSAMRGSRGAGYHRGRHGVDGVGVRRVRRCRPVGQTLGPSLDQDRRTAGKLPGLADQ